MTPRHLDLVLARPELADLDPAQRRIAIHALVRDARIPDGERVAADLSDYVDGYGALTPLMQDPAVTDVLVNGPSEVWVERDGALARTAVSFRDASELEAFVRTLLGRAGRSVDMSRPIGDGRLPDGARLHVVLPPAAPNGPLVSIRRFPPEGMGLDDLRDAGMIDDAAYRELRTAVADRKNLVIAGATGAGKTTLMNALLALVSPTERVVTIEETPELRMRNAHSVSLVTRTPNVEGEGEIDLTALLRAALRMRPDRIVVGEVRGAESLVALSAFSTGHEGSMVTVHARSPADVASRLVWLALQSSDSPSQRALEEQVRHAFDLAVFVARVKGQRAVTAIQSIA